MSGDRRQFRRRKIDAAAHPGNARSPNLWNRRVSGKDLFANSSDQLARFRSDCLGFIFQFHHLLPEFNALENVMMPGLIANEPLEPLRERAVTLLEEVGLAHRVEHPVGKLSGGERQRVAVARAVVREPALILADEPTGNLDPKTGDQILELLLELNNTHQSGLVVVTHSPEIATRLGRKLVLSDGCVAGAESFTDAPLSA